MPSVGDMLGQKKVGGVFAPGLDYAFGFVGDGYIERAQERGWLLNADSVATPATTNATEDLQIKATLEPFPDFKIDLNASRTMNRNKSVQFMYKGNPTTLNGAEVGDSPMPLKDGDTIALKGRSSGKTAMELKVQIVME